MAKHPKTATLTGFKGINNKVPAERLEIDEAGSSFLNAAVNVDVDSHGTLRLREGFTKRYDGTDVHSFWSDDIDVFFMEAGVLKKLNTIDYTASTLATGLHPSAEVTFLRVNDYVYYSSEHDNGMILPDYATRTWGLARPSGQPNLTAVVNGGLDEGVYQVAVTFVDVTGRESGTELAAKVAVPDTYKITLSNIPQSTDSDVTGIRVYVTTANGEELYFIGEIPHGTLTYDISTVQNAVVPITTQHFTNAPKGTILAYYNGRIYIAIGNTLWFSEAFGYEWFNLPSNFYQFPTDITALMPMDDGMFIGADRLYFLEGNSPENFRLNDREPYKVIKGTPSKIVGSDIRIENIPTGFKWLFTSDRGVGMAGTGGLIFNLTEENVIMGDSAYGKSLYRTDAGMNRYISLLRDPSNNRLHMGDQATAEVVRNGITI